MSELWRRIEAWLRRRSLDRDLEEELRFHLDMKARDTGDRAAAQRALGSPLLLRERAQDAWGWRWLDDALWDIRYALRQFRQNPGFTVAAVLTLALGIGVNATVFTVTNAMLFKGFPHVDPDNRILYIGTSGGESYPDFADWRAQAKSFTDMGVVNSGGLRVRLRDQRSGFGNVRRHAAECERFPRPGPPADTRARLRAHRRGARCAARDDSQLPFVGAPVPQGPGDRRSDHPAR